MAEFWAEAPPWDPCMDYLRTLGEKMATFKGEIMDGYYISTEKTSRKPYSTWVRGNLFLRIPRAPPPASTLVDLQK